MTTFLLALRQLSLGIWLGSLLMLGIAVAGPIFQLSASKTLAGEINGVILGRMNTIEWVCGVLVLLSSIGLAITTPSSMMDKVISVAGIFVMLVLLWVYSSQISGRMNELRSTIKDFDHPRTDTEYVQAKEEFDTLHHRYTTLVSVNMFLILGEFVWGMVRVRS